MKAKAIRYINSLINDETQKRELDIINFIKKCVNEHKEKEELPKNNYEQYFETLWKIYPRKSNKQLAKKTFEHKVRGLEEQDCKDKCNKIYKAMAFDMNKWTAEKRAENYLPHFSSWLNFNIPNSQHFKGK